MGYAWQRGLVPVGLAAMQRAIELNGVAVETNKLAFSLGRLAAADPAALRASCCTSRPAREPQAEIARRADRARGALHLTAYQNAAYAERYRRAGAQRARARGGAGRRATRRCR